MAKTHQTTFNGGILGPGMYDRTDVSKYASGVKDALNTIVLPEGGMQNRAGTQLAGGYDNSTGGTAPWLIPFEFSTEDTYMLEFGDGVMRVIKNGGYVLDTATAGQSVTAVTVANPAQLTMVDATAASQFTVGTLVYLSDPSGDHALGEQVLKVTAIASDTISFTICDTTTADTSTGAWGTLGAGAELFAVYELATPYAIEDMPTLDKAQDIDTLYLTSELYDFRALARIADDDWALTTISAAPSIDPPASILASRLSGTASVVSTYTVAAIDEGSGEESLPGTSSSISNNLSVSGSINRITWAAVAGASRYRVYKEFNGLFGFIGDTLSLQFDDENIVADTSKTPQQARDPFSTPDDRPRQVTFVEQRLTATSTVNNPQLVEMSNSQAPLNFNRALTPVDDDAITFRIRAQKLNRIVALVPGDPHMIFTAGAEWLLEGGDQKGYLAPGNPYTRPVTYYGSAEFPKPLSIGETVLHVMGNKRHIRRARNAEGPSSELTLLARHLFKRRTITSWAYAQNPDSVLWVTTDDGALLTLTYITEHEVWGWTRQQLGGPSATVRQVAVIREGTVDTPYFVVSRLLAGRVTTYVERLGPRDFTEVEDCYFMDCGFRYSGAAATELAGLLHLRGEAVSVLSDGNVIEDLTISAEGALTLPQAATKVSVGLPYEAFLTTLDVDFGAVQGLGSTRGRFKASNEVTVAVDETRGLAVGIPGGFMNEVKEFTGETPIPLFTGLYTVGIEGDWQRSASITVLQRYPLPMTVTGVAPNWELEDE